MISYVSYFAFVIFVLVNRCLSQTPEKSCSWEYEVRVSKLEASVASLVQEIARLKNENIQAKAELKVMNELIKNQCLAPSSSWKLTRVNVGFPSFAKLQLHELKPTYVEKVPVPLPNDTKAIIISVYCSFWNLNGHAYLGGEIQQKGNDEGGVVTIFNQHFNVYANTWYYELFVPWNTELSNEIMLKVTSSYLTGGLNNFYQLKMVGWITA